MRGHINYFKQEFKTRLSSEVTVLVIHGMNHTAASHRQWSRLDSHDYTINREMYFMVFQNYQTSKKVYSNKVHSLQRFTAASFIDLWELFDNVRTVASWKLWKMWLKHSLDRGKKTTNSELQKYSVIPSTILCSSPFGGPGPWFNMLSAKQTTPT